MIIELLPDFLVVPSPNTKPEKQKIIDKDFLVQTFDPVIDSSGNSLFVVSLVSMQDYYNELNNIWISIAIGLFVLMIIFAILTWLISLRIFKPIRLLTDATCCLAKGDFSARVNITGGDEVTELANSFNSMIEQIQYRDQSLTNTLKELSKRNEQLVLLNKVATGLANITSSAEVIEKGLELALEATSCQEGIIWLGAPGEKMQLASFKGISHDEICFLLKVNLPIATNINIDNLQNNFYSRDDLREKGYPDSILSRIYSVISAPLVSRGIIMGFIEIFCHTDNNVNFLPELLEAIGAEIGVALDNVRRFEEVRFQADHDPVTGLLNHRSFHQKCERELKLAERSGRQISLVMMDLDDFKLFNDTYGHPVGDEILRRVADSLIKIVLSTDFFCRYGGDEFAALLMDTSSEGAVKFAQRVKQCLYENSFISPDGDMVPIRMSFGVANFPKHSSSVNELITCADENMYFAKRNGGDGISVEET